MHVCGRADVCVCGCCINFTSLYQGVISQPNDLSSCVAGTMEFFGKSFVILCFAISVEIDGYNLFSIQPPNGLIHESDSVRWNINSIFINMYHTTERFTTHIHILIFVFSHLSIETHLVLEEEQVNIFGKQ